MSNAPTCKIRIFRAFDQIGDLPFAAMDDKEFINITDQNPIRRPHLFGRMGMAQFYSTDLFLIGNVAPKMRTPAPVGKRVQQGWRMVGAIIGHHDNVGKAKPSVPSDPFYQKRTFVAYRTDHCMTHDWPLAALWKALLGKTGCQALAPLSGFERR